MRKGGWLPQIARLSRALQERPLVIAAAATQVRQLTPVLGLAATEPLHYIPLILVLPHHTTTVIEGAKGHVKGLRRVYARPVAVYENVLLEEEETVISIKHPLLQLSNENK